MKYMKQKNLDELEQWGYTVVPGVLSEADCQLYIQQYVDWIENSFDKGSFPYTRHGIIHGYSVGHLAPSWKVRLQCRPVFEEVWGTQELLTSVDAVSIGRPPEQGEEEFHSQNQSWLHVDHGAGRLGFHIYQGAVFLETANMDDWVFECMVSSHKLLERFYEEHPMEREMTLKRGNDFMKLQEDHIKWYREKGCLRRRVAVPKGGLLLWDSRLVHNNARPMKGRANPNRWRFAVMVSMGPACWADKTSIRMKKRAYKELKMTAHWPCTGVRLFPPIPDDAPKAKKPLKALPKVATTLDAMQLMGIVSYNKLLKKSEKEKKDLGPDRTIPKPQFSPDYRPPPQPPSHSSTCGWVVVAVFSAMVCALSIYVYVYVVNKPK